MVEQAIIRLLLEVFRPPDPVVITGEELACDLTTQGYTISQQTVVALLQALEARGYLRLILLFSLPFDVIVTGITPHLQMLVQSSLTSSGAGDSLSLPS
jgi:hypothetical protein